MCRLGAIYQEVYVPLSQAQSQSLVQALADASWAGKDLSTRPAGYNNPDPTTGLTPHDEKILAGAAQMLTPAQLQVLMSDQIETNRESAIMKEYGSRGVTPSAEVVVP